jgi:serine/threonine protein kinase
VTGDVLFQDYPGAQMLARMESIMGKFPTHLINSGKYARRYFLNDGRIFEQNADKSIDVLTPNTSNLNILLDSFDPEMADFVSSLLSLDPQKRPSADIALSHPWLQS